MLTRQTNVTGTATIMTGYMITGFVAENDFGTQFFAAQSKRSVRTRFGAVVTGPATITNAFAGVGITR